MQAIKEEDIDHESGSYGDLKRILEEKVETLGKTIREKEGIIDKLDESSNYLKNSLQ
jgi:hypothetical protein